MISRKLVLLGLLIPLSACVKPPKKDSKQDSGSSPGQPTEGDQKPGEEEPSTDNPQTENPVPVIPVVVTYPVPDSDLGEALQDGEIDAAKQIASIIEEQIKAKYAPGSGKRALRDAHPKTHGCVKGEFAVDPNIPAEFAHGVFAKGNRFEAIARFSNSSEIPTQSDITKDGRGFAFKLLGVPGQKLLETERESGSQDFVMISHPVFFMKDPVEYVTFINKFENSDILSKLATVKSLGVLGTKIASDIKSLQVASPLQTQYFSNVPYQLGVGAAKKAVKYNARPCAINGSDAIPYDTKDDNYLRTRMKAHFEKSDACMDIYVQVRTDSSMSVEDSRYEWKTPWTKLATLTMKKGVQDIAATPDASIASNKACDTLSFNPWHALPEHKPLGSMNRVRKIVYEHISKLRHSINNEPRREPR